VSSSPSSPSPGRRTTGPGAVAALMGIMGGLCLLATFSARYDQAGVAKIVALAGVSAFFVAATIGIGLSRRWGAVFGVGASLVLLIAMTAMEGQRLFGIVIFGGLLLLMRTVWPRLR